MTQKNGINADNIFGSLVSNPRPEKVIWMDKYKHSELSNKIIKAFYQVYNTLGYGFLEKVYENALFLELREMGLFVENKSRSR